LVLQGAPESELKERAKNRRKERKRIFDHAMDALRSAIARGVPRNQAIVAARRSGLTLQAIGDMYGLTDERIRQIITGSDARRNREPRRRGTGRRRGDSST
jgi:DNA-directed RNA polymerase sigma subunit (sigma70/sigma32)